MSGISGVVRREGAAVDERMLDEMAVRLRPQGDHERRGMPEPNVALAVVEQANSGTPNCGGQALSLDGTIWIIADARLDNRGILRADLARAGEVITTDTGDVELILRAYRAWETDCVERLTGDFAFAIWDAGRRRLFCARDQFGFKPFYFAEKNGDFVFSNTLSSIRRHAAVSSRLNDQAVGDFLLFDFNRDLESTYFADIRRLPPAHCLSWSEGRVETRRYWRLPVDEELRYRDPEDYLEHFRELLRVAVRDRMRSDRVAVLMSGGVDSTAVAAAAAELAERAGYACSVRAFCTVYDRVIPNDERFYAELAAKHIGIPVSFLQADDYEFFRRPAGSLYRPAEPQNTPFYALWMDQFRMAAEFSPVALHGNGGDEILDQREGQLYAMLRSGNLRTAAREYARCLTAHGWLPRTGIRQALRGKLGGDSDWEPAFPAWLDPDFEARFDLRSRWRGAEEQSSPEHPRHPAAYRLLRDPIWPASFESFHPGATGCNLDVRHPLLDVRLARFCLSLPASPWMEDKGLLRAAMRGRLPSSVLRRPKTALPTTPEEVHLRRGGRFEAAIHPEVRRYVSQSLLERRLASGSVDVFVDLRPTALGNYLTDLEAVEPGLIWGSRRAA